MHERLVLKLFLTRLFLLTELTSQRPLFLEVLSHFLRLHQSLLLLMIFYFHLLQRVFVDIEVSISNVGVKEESVARTIIENKAFTSVTGQFADELLLPALLVRFLFGRVRIFRLPLPYLVVLTFRSSIFLF